MQYDRISKDLRRLARFGFDITEGHSCFIFLPSYVWNNLVERSPVKQLSDPYKNKDDSLTLAGYISNSNSIISQTRVSLDKGIIGWIAKHNRPVYISPYEKDSRSLEVYSSDQGIKTILGLPISINLKNNSMPNIGVLLCDSQQLSALQSQHMRLLDNLTLEISNFIQQTWENMFELGSAISWNDFQLSVIQLIKTLGAESTDIIRIKISNLHNIESTLGTAKAVEISESFARLVAQALPPYCPSYQISSDDLVVVLDNMLSAFIENKIKAIALRIAPSAHKLDLEFVKRPCLGSYNGVPAISHLFSEHNNTISLKTPIRING